MQARSLLNMHQINHFIKSLYISHPSTLCHRQATSLSFIDLSGNTLSGVIPDSVVDLVAKYTTEGIFDLRGNFLSCRFA